MLLGAATALRAETCVQHAPADLPRYEATLRSVCHTSGEAEFTNAYDEGQAMALDSVIKTLTQVGVG